MSVREKERKREAGEEPGWDMMKEEEEVKRREERKKKKNGRRKAVERAGRRIEERK